MDSICKEVPDKLLPEVYMSKDYKNLVISNRLNWGREYNLKPSPSKLHFYQQYYGKIIEKCPVRKDARIFEIGFGFGNFLYTLQTQGYSNLSGIDVVPEVVEYVRTDLNINKVETTDAITFFDKNIDTFDMIAAFDVVEHLNKNEIVHLPQKVWASLNQGGVFIMQVPNGGSPLGLYIRYSGFTHEVAFTSLSAEEVLKTVGFTDVTVYPDSDFIDKPSDYKNILKYNIRSFLRKIFAYVIDLDYRFAFCSNIIVFAFKK